MNREYLYMFIFIVSVFISSLAQILLKKSAVIKYSDMLKEYLNFKVLLAYMMFISSTVITIFSYKYIPLSTGAILESSGYIFVTALGAVFLKEKVNFKKILGILFIISGVVLLFLGSLCFK